MAQISEKAEETKECFPPEIFSEIVSRLPSKSVGRFTTVSKSWYTFIKSPSFIAAHLNQSIANNKGDDSSHYLLHISPVVKDYAYCSAYRDNTESFDEVFSLQLPMDFESLTCRPIGSCNGLVCLTDDEEDLHGRVIYLWNPVIRKHKCITGTSCCRTMFYDGCAKVYVGFWYDCANHDYKFIRIMINVLEDSSEWANQSQVELYSLNIGSWRKIDAKLPGILQFYHRPAFLNATINWIAFLPHGIGNADVFISSFDTSTEQFRKIELPKSKESHRLVEFPHLVVYKGCLALFVGSLGSNIWSVWVMNEFGVVESWVKKFNVKTDQKIYYPIGVTENDEIILCTEENVIAYNLETHTIRFRPCERSVHPSLPNYLSHTESLVFLDDENKLSETEIQAHLEAHPDENPSTLNEEKTNYG